MVVFTVCQAMSPTWRNLHSVSGTTTEKVAYNFIAEYGTAFESNVSISLIDETHDNNANRSIDLLFCFKRKFDHVGEDWRSCSFKIEEKGLNFKVYNGKQHISIERGVSFIEMDQKYFVYMKILSKEAIVVNYNIKFIVHSCERDEVESPNRECIPYSDITHNTTLKDSTQTREETKTYRLHVPIVENSIVGGIKFNILLNQTSKVFLMGKLGASPTHLYSDFEFEENNRKHVMFNTNSTTSGYWYLSIQFTEPVKFEINATVSYCSIETDTFGYECDEKIIDLDDYNKIIVTYAMNKRLRIFKFNANPMNVEGNLVNVSIGTYRYREGETNSFNFYLSIDELPYFSHDSRSAYFDASDCSLESKRCTHIKTLIMDKRATSNYYIGIRYPDNVYGSREFGLFNNSLCPECYNNGNCTLNKEHGNRYYCACTEDYVGLDCRLEGYNLKTYMIVIIIIFGVLLFLGMLIPPIIFLKRTNEDTPYQRLVSD